MFPFLQPGSHSQSQSRVPFISCRAAALMAASQETGYGDTAAS